MAATTTKQQNTTAPPPLKDPQSKGQVTVLGPARMLLPEEFKKEFDIGTTEWRTLTDAIFPAAKTIEAVGMALAYCKKRNLDIFKRPVHIVPVWNSALKKLVETVWPAISELRTTAMRTKNYAGMDAAAYGPLIKHKFGGGKYKTTNDHGGDVWKTEDTIELEIHEWCQITVYRLLQGNRVPFPGPRVYWLETYATKARFSTLPNEMWEKRSSGQLEKCAEAAALRRAFPEEIGDDYVPEEIGAFHTVDVTEQGSATTAPPEPTRETVKAAQTQPIDQDGGKADIAKNTQDTGKAQAAKNDPPHDPETGEIKQQPKQNKAELTDVEDLNDQPISFEAYTKIGDFFTFSDAWLEDPKRTPAEAKQWEEFYRDYIKEKTTHSNPKIREAIADTIGLYSAVLAKEQAE